MDEVDQKLRQKLRMFSEIDQRIFNQEKEISRDLGNPMRERNAESEIRPGKRHSAIKDSQNFDYPRKADYRYLYNGGAEFERPQASRHKDTSKLKSNKYISMKPPSHGPPQTHKKQKPTGNTFERLYQDAFRVKSKLEAQRKIQDYEFSSKMRPAITPRASSIERNPCNFEDRLHPSLMGQAYRTDRSVRKILNESSLVDLYGNPDHESFYRPTNSPCHHQRRDFSFSPSINSRSDSLARKMGPSFQRLTSKTRSSRKVRNTVDRQDSRAEASFDSAHSLRLYQSGLEKMRKRQADYERNKSELNESYKNYPYKPQTSSTTNYLSREVNKSDFHQRSAEWSKRQAAKSKKRREYFEGLAKKKCSFAPEISTAVVQDDRRIINRNIGQIYDYVQKQKKLRSQKEQEEEYRNRRFFKQTERATKRTTPLEPKLQTQQRSSRSRSSSRPKGDVLKIREDSNTGSFYSRPTRQSETRSADLGADNKKFSEAVKTLNVKLKGIKL